MAQGDGGMLPFNLHSTATTTLRSLNVDSDRHQCRFCSRRFELQLIRDYYSLPSLLSYRCMSLAHISPLRLTLKLLSFYARRLYLCKHFSCDLS